MAKMTGARALAEMFKGYGVTHFFMVPAIMRRAMAEMEAHTDIVSIQTHGEASAAYMADGYARASGKVGVCGAQIIGAMNLAAGLRDAWLAKVPVLAITGGRDPRWTFRGNYQEVDDVPSFDKVTKFNATIDDVSRIPDLLRTAFRVAVSGTPGPVHLQLRGNEGQMELEEADMEALCDPMFAAVPPLRPEPAEDQLRKALALLEAADRPVIVAGGGIRHSQAGRDLVALAERLQIPVATSLNGKDSISGNHPLSVGVVGTYSRESANRTVAAADLVFFAGTSAGGMVTHFWAVPKPGVKAVQLDINGEELGRNYPLAAAVLGDAKVALSRMAAMTNGASASRRKAWVAQAQSFVAEWRGKYKPLLESEAQPMRPERICHELSKNLPSDAIVLADTGHSGMWMGGMYDLNSPDQSYIRSGGHLGWSFAAGLGAKCAAPNRPVVVFNGDSAFWYHLSEIETAVRMGINSVTVVNNNGGGNQSKRGFDRAWGGEQTDYARSLWMFRKTNFAKIAEDMGAVGMRVEKPSDFAPALEKAIAMKRPVIIDAVSDIEAMAPLAVSG